MATEARPEVIRESVRKHYAEAAKQAQAASKSSCCSSAQSQCCDSSARIYDPTQLQQVPEAAALASLGCGNPTALAELKSGEVVLDLGSGGGIDVFLAARRVGPTGKVYGLDMTDEMLSLARENARKARVANVEFIKGQIESIPLPDASVDVIISNCVINLSADKDAVLTEAFRVLRPGGRFAVSDVVVEGGSLPPKLQEMLSLWAGCIAGALGDDEYKQKLTRAGFTGVGMEVGHVYGVEDLPEQVTCCALPDLSLAPGTRIVSAFIRATKPAS